MKFTTKTFLALAFILYMIGCLASCYTAKKADKQVGKALSQYPGKVAAIARAAFPCITTKADTLTTTDTLYDFIDCPENQYVVNTAQPQAEVVRNIIRVPVKIPVRTITITTEVEDSAKIWAYQDRHEEDLKTVSNRDKQLIKKDTTIAYLEAKNKKKNKYLLWLLIALVASNAGRIIKLFV